MYTCVIHRDPSYILDMGSGYLVELYFVLQTYGYI